MQPALKNPVTGLPGIITQMTFFQTVGIFQVAPPSQNPEMTITMDMHESRVGVTSESEGAFIHSDEELHNTELRSCCWS